MVRLGLGRFGVGFLVGSCHCARGNTESMTEKSISPDPFPFNLKFQRAELEKRTHDLFCALSKSHTDTTEDRGCRSDALQRGERQEMGMGEAGDGKSKITQSYLVLRPSSCVVLGKQI